MLNGLEEIDGLTPEQIEAINGKAKGILDKNAELLGKISSNSNDKSASAAELQALKQFKTNAEIKAAEDAKNWDKATKLKQEAWDKEKEDLTKSNFEGKELISKLLIGDGLSKALDSVNINPALKTGAEAMLSATAKILDGKAMIGDKSLSEAVKEWSSSDAGKAFCLAPNNSNGDATGGNNDSSGKKMTLTEKAIAANQT